MFENRATKGTRRAAARPVLIVSAVLAVAAVAALSLWYFGRDAAPSATGTDEREASANVHYKPRGILDTGGYGTVTAHVEPWGSDATLRDVARRWDRAGYRTAAVMDEQLKSTSLTSQERIDLLLAKAVSLNYEGQAAIAYEALTEARRIAESKRELAEKHLYELVYMQGVTALRRGENENCIECRGESSCILPISKAAVHTIPEGSQLAVKHFTEYLKAFPHDLEAKWLLNLAYMTLGQYPAQVPLELRTSLEYRSEPVHGIGKFRDIGAAVGINRFDQAGGLILEDFDNDGLLDVFVTSMDCTAPAGFYRNKGDGTFEDRSVQAGLAEQLGGLYCVQADYDNDGFADVLIPRGAWHVHPVRSSLLHNNGDGTFTDVTKTAGMDEPANSISASWADFDNDGLLDLFFCCELTDNRLYRNRGDGTFEEIAKKAGVLGSLQHCKGAAWIDFDNDRYPDLFVDYYLGSAELYRNNRDGTFTEISRDLGVDGPTKGFACWAWDYDNDGFLDLFASCYDYSLKGVIKGLQGKPHNGNINRLFRNVDGKRFEDVTVKSGLHVPLAAMGCNYGDFDNDGFLDAYFGSGDPNIDVLIPNRAFRNLGGKRFAEITRSSGMGHLQKGHAVACGDWDRDGNVDIFMQMGGAINGDRYHNVLFQNPGNHGNSWLTLKLVGTKSNRAAIGARIKIVTAGDNPQTIHRHVSTGSSFGANPFQQSIGLAKASRIALLEIYWPTSDVTQRIRDLEVNQAIEVTEGEHAAFRKLNWKQIPLPKAAQ